MARRRYVVCWLTNVMVRRVTERVHHDSFGAVCCQSARPERGIFKFVLYFYADLTLFAFSQRRFGNITVDHFHLHAVQYFWNKHRHFGASAATNIQKRLGGNEADLTARQSTARLHKALVRVLGLDLLDELFERKWS